MTAAKRVIQKLEQNVKIDNLHVFTNVDSKEDFFDFSNWSKALRQNF